MSYPTSKGEYVDAKTKTWTQTLQSADANGDALELGQNRSCVATLSVTAVSTDDTIDVKIQGSWDNSTWFDIVAFTQVTSAPTTAYKTFVGARYIRPVFNVEGVAAVAITSSVYVEAV